MTTIKNQKLQNGEHVYVKLGSQHGGAKVLKDNGPTVEVKAQSVNVLTVKKSQIENSPNPEKGKAPKQLEDELGMSAALIRKKLRKLFPELAKKGTWKITPAMVEALNND